MKICLINSNFTEQIMPNFMVNFEAGLLSLAAVLEENRFKVKIINLYQLIKQKKIIADSFFCDNAARFIIERGIDILGFNTRCDTYPIVLNIARKCKELNPSSIIILGGPQSTFTDLETLREFPFIDVIVRGEGEQTLLDLMRLFKSYKDRNLKDVAGITYRKNDRIVQNKPRELIKDLDSLPMPAYHLVEDYFPAPDELKYGWIYISIGRGCPHNCTYCSTGKMWQKCYRLRSPRNILKEIKFLKKRYGISRFYLGHDNFLTKKEDVIKLCNLLLQSKIGIKWTCSSRIDSIDASVLKIMSESGCQRIFFGIESGSPKIQKIIKKNIDVSVIPGRLKECEKYNIATALSFIVGFPEEKAEDLNATLGWALKARLSRNSYSYIRLLMPMPSTTLFMKNRDRLVLRDSWNHLYLIGDLIKKVSWSKNLIKKYPLIFSSFYTIKLKYFSKNLPYEAVTTFSTLLCAYPMSSYISLHELRISPLILLQELKLWGKKKRLNRGKKAITLLRSLCLRYFPAFLEDMYKQKDISIKLVSHILNLEKKNCSDIYNKL